MTEAPNEPQKSSVKRGLGELKQQAYEQIEDLLNLGVLRPGEIISQRELVEHTGSSLGSIREAVMRLEAEGLLIPIPKRGLMVPSLDKDFVHDAYQLRRIIECAAVPDMVAKLKDETIARFLAEQNAFAEEVPADGIASDDLLDRVQHADWDMHSTFVAAMGNRLIENTYRITAIKIRMAVQYRIKVTGENVLRVIGEHKAILLPLAARNAEATTAALARHINVSMTLALHGTVAADPKARRTD